MLFWLDANLSYVIVVIGYIHVPDEPVTTQTGGIWAFLGRCTARGVGVEDKRLYV